MKKGQRTWNKDESEKNRVYSYKTRLGGLLLGYVNFVNGHYYGYALEKDGGGYALLLKSRDLQAVQSEIEGKEYNL